MLSRGPNLAWVSPKPRPSPLQAGRGNGALGRAHGEKSEGHFRGIQSGLCRSPEGLPQCGLVHPNPGCPPSHKGAVGSWVPELQPTQPPLGPEGESEVHLGKGGVADSLLSLCSSWVETTGVLPARAPCDTTLPLS